MQYIMETIIIDLVKAKRPPHPMKRAIGWWNDALEDWTEEDATKLKPVGFNANRGSNAVVVSTC